MSRFAEMAERLAREGGEFMLNARRDPHLMKVSTKPDGSRVTNADLAIQELAIEAISQAFPDHLSMGRNESMATPMPAFSGLLTP